jgi:hypothetical protein
MLDALGIHQRWEGEVGRSFGERMHHPSAMEAVEFCTVLTRGEPVNMEFSARPGIEVKTVSMLLGTYALWLLMEPIQSMLPKPIPDGTPVSAENPGGSRR